MKNLFTEIDQTIRKEKLYADVALQRQDVCDRFGINRHALNELLVHYAEGLSFPQYVNDIRLQEALRLLHNERLPVLWVLLPPTCANNSSAFTE